MTTATTKTAAACTKEEERAFREQLVTLAESATAEAMGELVSMMGALGMRVPEPASKTSVCYALSRRLDVLLPGSAVRTPDVPSRFMDPITLDVMLRPAAASDGHVYDATTLEAMDNNRSPITGQELLGYAYELVHMRNEIKEWVTDNGHPAVERLAGGGGRLRLCEPCAGLPDGFDGVVQIGCTGGHARFHPPSAADVLPHQQHQQQHAQERPSAYGPSPYDQSQSQQRQQFQQQQHPSYRPTTSDPSTTSAPYNAFQTGAAAAQQQYPPAYGGLRGGGGGGNAGSAAAAADVGPVLSSLVDICRSVLQPISSGGVQQQHYDQAMPPHQPFHHAQHQQQQHYPVAAAQQHQQPQFQQQQQHPEHPEQQPSQHPRPATYFAQGPSVVGFGIGSGAAGGGAASSRASPLIPADDDIFAGGSREEQHEENDN